MDGQKFLPSRFLSIILTLAFFACVALAPPRASAQAMGKATLDTPVSTTQSTPSSLQIPPPPTPSIPVPLTTITPKSATPLISELKSPPPPAAEAKPLPLPPVLPDPKPEITPKPQLEATPKSLPESTPKTQPEKIIDSLPSELTRPSTPALAIESKPIRPAASDNATSSNDTKTAGAVPGEKSSFFSGLQSVLQVAAALAVVLGLVFIGKVLAKKFIPSAKAGNGKGVIEILARYPLSKNQSLVLVRIGSQIVTLNQGKDQSQSVLVISDPEEVAKIMGQIEGTSPKSIQAGFNKLLANARMDLESPTHNPDNDFESRSLEPENLDNQLEEMAAAKRQLMQLRQQVRSVRDSLPR